MDFRFCSLLRERAFGGPLASNGFPRQFVAAGEGAFGEPLSSNGLSTIPAFRRHVTLYFRGFVEI
jgi:hypothetical protein